MGGMELVAKLLGALAGSMRRAAGQPEHVVMRFVAGDTIAEMQLVPNGKKPCLRVVYIMDGLLFVARMEFATKTLRL